MGFLDNLVRRAVNRAVDTAVDSVMDTVLGRKDPFPANVVSEPAPAKVNVVPKTDGAAAENRAATKCENISGEELLRRRIETIAAREKPEFELRRQVSTREVDAPAGAREFFDYGFYRDGILVAVIVILHNSSAYRTKKVRLAQRACGDRQVGYMNFMSYMMNRPEYIAQRFAQIVR